MGFTEGQFGHLAEHDSINALTATHTSQIAAGDVTVPTSAAAISLSATFAPLRNIDVKTFGAKGDGVTDDTAAIQSAITACAPGQTIFFPATGSGAFYRITAGLVVTTPSIRFLGQPRDAYSMSIRCAVGGVTMITVKAAGFVMKNIGLIGVEVLANGGENGVGMTVNGIELFGDLNGNIDSAIQGVTFQYLNVSARVRARNSTFSNECLFNNVLYGVIFDELDAAFHTGPSAAGQNRGNTVRGCRFHNVGTSSVGAGIQFTPTAQILHAIVQDNFFDSSGFGRHIVATGTATNPVNRLTCTGNKHTEVSAAAYDFTFVVNSTISNADIAGFTAVDSTYNAIMLTSCDTVVVSDVFGLQVGGSGMYGRSNVRVWVRDTKFRALGQSSTVVGHGIDFDSTNSACRFDQVVIDGTDGWGFLGDVTDSVMTDCEFRTCALGNISSTTLLNRASRGLNVYIEGIGGRKEDSASKAFDLTVAAGATQVATVVGGSVYTSFETEVRVIGRNSGGPLYARYVRYVRPENGVPAYLTPVADYASGSVAVTFAAYGTTGVSVSVTITGSDGFATVQVLARAGGGAATGNPRGVTVVMS